MNKRCVQAFVACCAAVSIFIQPARLPTCTSAASSTPRQRTRKGMSHRSCARSTLFTLLPNKNESSILSDELGLQSLIAGAVAECRFAGCRLGPTDAVSVSAWQSTEHDHSRHLERFKIICSVVVLLLGRSVQACSTMFAACQRESAPVTGASKTLGTRRCSKDRGVFTCERYGREAACLDARLT